MHIVPAIDIIDGKCVRLEQGHYDRKKVYHDNPVDVAKAFSDHGIQRLHLVDLDGAKASKVVNHSVLENISRSTKLLIDWGGGIKSEADLDLVFQCGANQATVGSIAAENPQLFHRWLGKYGPQRLILGADLKEGKIATRGWKELSSLQWQEFFKMHLAKGIKTIISTDVSRDGMLEGPAFDLYQQMIDLYPGVELVASGGISSIDDLYKLRDLGCYAAIIGKAIYEQKITLKQLQVFQSAC
ncbi:MAG: 1-(5-phosphoribosyl)-5-[(5-phosphoribosylamino)methylideneamino]imidazole-4-carboxamide isomerase [Saprospiraceae bacterium]|nr:1-(5-phosphoribosyl)-5-[(5-phosphoribosylamino)methylideneamino]imidazole-4-carboxamide isomerase [Saprospiraceae bacterium]